MRHSQVVLPRRLGGPGCDEVTLCMLCAACCDAPVQGGLDSGELGLSRTSSGPADWALRGYNLLDAKMFEQAATCFVQAGDPVRAQVGGRAGGRAAGGSGAGGPAGHGVGRTVGLWACSARVGGWVRWCGGAMLCLYGLRSGPVH